MIRLVKRYGGGSRKLYDTEESRYVSLDEIAAWVRRGQQLRVVDNDSGEDVTAQTLAQVIYEAHRTGTGMLGVDFLHDAIRRGGKVIGEKVGRIQSGVGRLVRRGVTQLPGAQSAGTELAALRRSLRALERSVNKLEQSSARPSRRAGASKRSKPRAGVRRGSPDR